MGEIQRLVQAGRKFLLRRCCSTKERSLKRFTLLKRDACGSLSIRTGKTLLFSFSSKGEGVSSAESFRYNQPSLYSIESLEHSVVHTLTKKDYFDIVGASPLIRQAMEEQTLQRLLYVEKTFSVEDQKQS
jgi:CRP-like cAMP-binding protein